MGIFGKKNSGLTYDGQGDERSGGFGDGIKYNWEEGNEELVKKFSYENISQFNFLIVNESQEALFHSGGAFSDIFPPGRHELDTNNTPFLGRLRDRILFGGKTSFPAEVWFVNKTIRRNLKFGTPVPIELLDPLYQIPVPVRSFGEFGIQISDSHKFVKDFVGTLHSHTNDDFVAQFSALINRKLSSCISKYIVMNNVSVVQINTLLDDISNYIRDAVKEELANYGIALINFDVESVNFDKNDPNVAKILDSQSEAAKRRMEGYNYQQERQFDIMEGAANNEGGAGQMMGAGMGLGMGFGVGGAFGQQMGNIASSVNQAQPVGGPPPPPTVSAYHVLINNVQQGPYDITTLQQMVKSGQITRESYVWKNGMAQWDKAANCADLQNFFGAVPPPPPTV
ncbi:SPFH domain-containing protein [Bacteroidales bacterium OttesenSCG-928-C19]|nr:SPFH domain-containing protein [Bacteroidales bacterium OttesenSCG-928-C19]